MDRPLAPVAPKVTQRESVHARHPLPSELVHP
mgnify:CR=1 FL=1